MNIALIDTTQKRFASYVPLALLRLSTAHKNEGDTVELISAGKLPRRTPDKIYFSFIFLFDYKSDVKWVLTYRQKYPQATRKVPTSGMFQGVSKEMQEAMVLGVNAFMRLEE